MSVSTVGIFKNNIRTFEVWNYIKENFDSAATVEVSQPNKSEYIHFTYNNESRMMHCYMDSEDYKSDTNYSGLINSISLGASGCSIEVIEPIVRYFGGWFMASDGYDRGNIQFYDFKYNEDLTNDEKIEKAILEKLSDEKNWELKMGVFNFVKNNLDFIKKL